MQPPGVWKQSVVALREKNRLLSTSTRDWWYIFYPRSTVDLIMTGQRSIFGEIDVFPNLQGNSDEAIANIAMKSLSSCSVENWHPFDI